MIQTSQNWIDIYRRPLVNQGYVRINIGITDPDADADMTGSDSGHLSYSKISQPLAAHQKRIKRYATLEQNQWALDGSVQFSETGDVGYISDGLSAADRTMNETVTILYSQVHANPLPGLSILFDDTLGGEFASDFTITIYNGTTVVAQTSIEDNLEPQRYINIEFSNYNKIEIAITKWCLPYRHARINDIMLGTGKSFTEADLISYSHEMLMSPINDEMPKNEIVFEIDNTEGIFDIGEETGLSKYLMARQKVDAQYGLKLDDGTVEWINGGTFYLFDWSAKYGSISARFKARDKVTQLQNTFFDIVAGETLGAKFQRLLNASILTQSDYVLNLGDSADILVGYLPDTSFANCLQYLCQAANIGFWISRDGVFHFEPLDEDPQGYVINNDIMYDWPNVAKSAGLRAISVNIYTYASKDEYTVTPYLYEIPGTDLSMQEMKIDNPLVISQDNANDIILYILSNKLDTFTIDSTFRADPRADGGDMYIQFLKDKSYNTVMRNLKYTFNGAFRGACTSGVTSVIEIPPTSDIVFTPEVLSVDLSEWKLTDRPTLSFTLHADMVPAGIKYITWSARTAQITSSVSTPTPDTITLNQSGSGADLEVVITGNNRFGLTNNASYAYGFSTQSLILTATTSDGYTEDFVVTVTRNSQVTDITFTPIATLNFDVMQTSQPTMNIPVSATTQGLINAPLRFSIKSLSNISAVGNVNNDYVTGYQSVALQAAIIRWAGSYHYAVQYFDGIAWKITNYYSYSSNVIVLQAIAPNGFIKEYSIPINNPIRSVFTFTPTTISVPNSSDTDDFMRSADISTSQPSNFYMRLFTDVVVYGSSYEPSSGATWNGDFRGQVGSNYGDAGGNGNTPTRTRLRIDSGLVITSDSFMYVFGYNSFSATQVTWFKGPVPTTVNFNITH